MPIVKLLLIAGIVAVCAAQTQSPRKLIPSLEGKELYAAYCASCHGLDGKGQGPVAVALKNPVPDLTLIAKRRDSKFPMLDLEKMILGQGELKAVHGNRDMPVWGPVFQRVEQDQDLGLIRVRRLVEYLKTLQTR